MSNLSFLTSNRFSLLLATQALIAVVLPGSESRLLPAPDAILRSWLDLTQTPALLAALWDSFKVLWLALLLTSAAALAAAGMGLLFNVHHKGTTLLCFLALIFGSCLLMRVAGETMQPRLSLLAWALTLILIPKVYALAHTIPQQALDQCHALGMSNGRTTWELLILGKGDLMLDLLRQNAAIGWAWAVLTESLIHAPDGIGGLLFKPGSGFTPGSLLAIQITILCLGFGQDLLLG